MPRINTKKTLRFSGANILCNGKKYFHEFTVVQDAEEQYVQFNAYILDEDAKDMQSNGVVKIPVEIFTRFWANVCSSARTGGDDIDERLAEGEQED